MLKTKRIFIALLLGIVMIFGVAGCNNEPPTGTFYTLQEAYDNGFLTKEDLQAVAGYHNKNILCSQSLDETVAKKIKESAAFKLRNQNRPIDYAKADDFVILSFYGCYNGSYVIRLNTPYEESPAVIVDNWVDISDSGVKIHYKSFYLIEIWKENV